MRLGTSANPEWIGPGGHAIGHRPNWSRKEKSFFQLKLLLNRLYFLIELNLQLRLEAGLAREKVLHKI